MVPHGTHAARGPTPRRAPEFRNAHRPDGRKPRGPGAPTRKPCTAHHDPATATHNHPDGQTPGSSPHAQRSGTPGGRLGFGAPGWDTGHSLHKEDTVADTPYPRLVDWDVFDEDEDPGKTLWLGAVLVGLSLANILLGIQSIAPRDGDRYPMI